MGYGSIERKETCMEKKKVVGIDIVRAGALLLVIMYHIWVLGAQNQIPIASVQRFLQLGGEIGVTLFFALSGFGIFYSLNSTEKREGKIQYFPFLKKRCIRILPQYYTNIFLVTMIGVGAYALTTSNWKDFVSHFLMIHNLSPSYAGSLNGVLWTMGVTMQFYLIAILLYKLLMKLKWLFLPLTVFLTIAMKAVAYHYYFDVLQDGINSFFVGRQCCILTVLDNFTVGMFVAWMVQRKKKDSAVVWLILSIVSIVALNIICKYGLVYGIHTNNISGYCWHSLVALAAGVLILAFAYFPFGSNGIIVRMFRFLSEYQYGIYLWHLVVINNLLSASGFVAELRNKGYILLLYLVLCVVSVITGVLMTKAIDEGLMKNWKRSK